MEIREYQSTDCKEIAELFYHTVHTVNAKDYTKEQLDVWATGKVDLEKWDRSFCEHDTVVAVEDRQIVGFGDMDDTGYLDRLYVHAKYQRRGSHRQSVIVWRENGWNKRLREKMSRRRS